jgi:hypothetical protein
MKRQRSSQVNWHNLLINAALSFLVLHLFTVNSRLLAHLNVDSKTAGNVFDFNNLQLDNIIAMVISVSYSIITAIILKISFFRRFSIVLIGWFSLIDGAGVFIYYSVFPNFQTIGAFYYAIYTFSIIMAIGLYQKHKKNNGDRDKVEDNELTILRKQLYNRRKNLKYKGADLENDKIIKDLNKAINNLINR